jgi:hypothetical protein
MGLAALLLLFLLFVIRAIELLRLRKRHGIVQPVEIRDACGKVTSMFGFLEGKNT